MDFRTSTRLLPAFVIALVPSIALAQSTTLDFKGKVESVVVSPDSSPMSGIGEGIVIDGSLTVVQPQERPGISAAGTGSVTWGESVSKFSIGAPLDVSFEGGAIVLTDGVLSIRQNKNYCDNATVRGVSTPCAAKGSSITSDSSKPMVLTSYWG